MADDGALTVCGGAISIVLALVETEGRGVGKGLVGRALGFVSSSCFGGWGAKS